ncbi:hypothetical protein [Candidatus Laterigemmans baculatus]|nr:hypothetical protein [Candidatus Laterigemmans baculatus]
MSLPVQGERVWGEAWVTLGDDLAICSVVVCFSCFDAHGVQVR